MTETVADEVAIAVAVIVAVAADIAQLVDEDMKNHIMPLPPEVKGQGQGTMYVQHKYRIDSLLDLDVSRSSNHAQHGRCASVAGGRGCLVSYSMLNPVQHAAAVAQASSE